MIDDELVGGVLGRAVKDRHSNVFGRDVDELLSMLNGTTGPDRLVDALVRTGPWGDGFGVDAKGITLQTLIDNPHGIDFGPLEPQLPGNLRTPSGKVELAPVSIVAASPALLATATASAAADDLRLIGRRQLRSNNSWMHNIRVLVKGKDRCTLLMHPDDAGVRGLTDGDSARIASRVGSVDVAVEVSDEMMPGVVCLPHGWGHDVPGTRMSVASERPGVNLNVLTDGAVLDDLSGNATLNGIPVTVCAAG